MKPFGASETTEERLKILFVRKQTSLNSDTLSNVAFYMYYSNFYKVAEPQRTIQSNFAGSSKRSSHFLLGSIGTNIYILMLNFANMITESYELRI